MNISQDFTAICFFMSYICVINVLSLSLCAQQLFCSLMWINISLDNFHSPVDSCLPAIKAAIWKWPESLWHSKCIEITQHKSQCISNTLLYHHPLHLHISQTLLQIQYCALTSTILNGRMLSACIMQYKNSYSTQGFQVSSLVRHTKYRGIEGTAAKFQSTATIKWQMTKQALICWTWFDKLVHPSA